jgi:hypothetical protein
MLVQRAVKFPFESDGEIADRQKNAVELISGEAQKIM